jgi:tRNA nucleotidyltransferase/poly(A) polymerase
VNPSEQKALLLIEKLEAAGYEARFVGGCVRDAVMGRKLGDIDLATTSTPDETTRVLKDAGLQVVPTGIDHGTVTAVVEGVGFEITTLRQDIETDGRHAKVIFTKSWEQDAKRRDFTLNTLSRDKSGKIHDYVGGYQDALDGYIRFVGDARERIKEDYLRILRFFRFQATHGKGLPEEEALKACHEGAAHLKDLSRERVWKELKKLLAANDPYPAYQRMQDCGVAHKILPEGHPQRLEKLVALEGTLKAYARDPMLRLAALTHGEKTESEMLEERFALSNNESKNVSLFLDYSREKESEMGEKEVGRLAYRYGLDKAGKILLLAGVLGAQFDWDFLAKVLEKTHVKTFPLKGEDVLALGLKSGPEVGEILHKVEAWWIENGFTPDRAACLVELKKRAGR